jgi:predicted dehydrogenase
MVDQEMRLSDGVRDMPSLLEERIGPLRKLVVGVTMAEAEWGGWRGDKALSGGTLFEMAVHELDFARWLWQKDPVSIFAQGEDTAGKDMTVLFDFASGDSAIIELCWRCIGFRIRAELYGARGYAIEEMEIPFGPNRRTIVTEAGRELLERSYALQGPETFKRVMEGFVQAIQTGAPPPITAEDGVWAVRMAESARESLRTGQPVRF